MKNFSNQRNSIKVIKNRLNNEKKNQIGRFNFNYVNNHIKCKLPKDQN